MLAANRQATASSSKRMVEDCEHQFGFLLNVRKQGGDCGGSGGRQEVQCVVLGVLCVAFE